MSITIRPATIDDLENVNRIESECFPEAEAATYDSLKRRLRDFKTSYLVAEKNGRIVGHVNGCVTKETHLIDELYSSNDLHDEAAPNQMIFGLATDPKEQHQGIASKLMKAYIDVAKEHNRESIILTCKDHLIPFYCSFGFKDKGISNSTHGGVQWHEMVLTLK